METSAQPVGGPLLSRAYKVLIALASLGVLLTIWRFYVGLGPSTGLSDGYPLGLWIALDVVTGTALACGGYAVALIVYIFNRGRYHPLVRPAILTSALGYSMAGLSVAIDLGRPWNMWKIPVYFWSWNLNSPLLEVALCIMAYVFVLWIELSPALLGGYVPRVRAFLEKALIWIIALGMVLPTMHQSSLGALMLLSGPKLHPLWNTPFLPLLFLITCISMGYSMVVFESLFSSMAFKRRPEGEMLFAIQKVAVWLGVVFVAFRIIDLGFRGRLALLGQFDLYGIMFWIETLLWLLPLAMMIALPGASLGNLFRSALVIAIAGALYRFDTYLVAFNPGPGWSYFPSVAEIFISVGVISFEIALYVFLVKRFPIIGGISYAK